MPREILVPAPRSPQVVEGAREAGPSSDRAATGVFVSTLATDSLQGRRVAMRGSAQTWRRACSRPETEPQPSASDQGEQSLHQLAVWPGQRFEDREMVGPVDWQQMPRQSVHGPRLGVANRLAA
jgi:hypothetical protein